MENVIEPVSYIINMSLDTGIISDDLKIAKVIPIYKSSDPSLMKNYRPISLLPAFSKLLETIVYDKLMSFLVSKNIFYKHQCGVRPKHSTIHPIMHFLNHCAEANNKQILNLHWQYIVIFPKLLTLLIIQLLWISLIIMELEVLQTTGSKSI